jgi:hypothetical protein
MCLRGSNFSGRRQLVDGVTTGSTHAADNGHDHHGDAQGSNDQRDDRASAHAGRPGHLAVGLCQSVPSEI